MTDDNRANIARLEERIEGVKDNFYEKLSGTSKAIYILLEVASKDRDDYKRKVESLEKRALTNEAELTRLKQEHASGTQVKVALISAVGAVIAAVIALSQVFF